MEGSYCLVALVGQVALVRPLLEQVGPLRQRQAVTELEHPCVLGRGLAVGAHRGGPPGLGEGKPYDGLGVTGGFGVVSQAGELSALLGEQRGRQGWRCKLVLPPRA